MRSVIGGPMQACARRAARDRLCSWAKRPPGVATGPDLDSDSPFKSRGGPTRLLGAFRYSFAGLRSAFRAEAAFRQELALCAVAVPLALWLPVTPLERLLMIGSLALVLVVELLNSAIEALVDRIGLERNPLSRRAKDLGSAAVMLTLMLAGATWLTLLWPLIRTWAQ